MSSEVAGLLSGSGYGLMAVTCCLILLEELGIPMPFAPGDLLLVLAGVSIAATHLNPLVVVAATYVSAMVGAVTGREIFERIGTAALPRFGRLLHASKRVENLTARLRRNGAAAVFLGRITPGLRIVTTYVAGLIGIPRWTFLKGLAPGIAVYQAVFVGIGFLLGPAAGATIERYEPKPSQLVLLLLIVGGAALVTHAITKRVRAAAIKGGEMMEVQT